MTARSLFRFAVLAAVIACCAHVAWSAGISFALREAYPHRTADLRRWPGSDRDPDVQRELLARFVGGSLRNAARPTVAFLGSSFSFGYPWQERVILSRRYAEMRPDQHVVNASITGADLSRVNNWSICALQRQGLVVDAAVIEVPVINTVGRLREEFDAGAEIHQLEACAVPRVSDSYLPLVLRHPLGLGWVRFLWDVEAYEKPDQEISIVRVPDSYFVDASKFAHIEHIYRAQVADALQRALSIAKKVYAFPSPVYLPALREIDEDVSAVAHQLQVTGEACRSIGGVECLDISAFLENRDAYYNMTHLNQRGHQQLAEWLAREIPR